MKVSAKLEEDFKQELVKLLKEYKNVLSWLYLDMEGINPKFYQHKINLKEGATPVKVTKIHSEPQLCQIGKKRN